MFELPRLIENALPEYVSPVPAVVVAYDPTSPPYVASPPSERAGSLNAPEKVDDAVENSPPVIKPMVDVVELYPLLTVNGKANPDLELSVV